MVLRLATPTVLAMLAQSAVNEVDIIFFSWLPHPESSIAQAALLPSLILLWMFGGSLSAISVGTQALAARRFAEGRPADAGTVLANSWFFSLLAGIAFTLLGYLVIPHVLGVLVSSAEVREVAEGYLDYRLLGITSKNRSVKAVENDTIPVTWIGFAVAVVTGVLLFVSKATTYMANPYFLWKMGLMAVAGINMAIFHRVISKGVEEWGQPGGTIPGAAKLSGALSLGIWLIIPFCGRVIGFTLGVYY